MTQRERIAFGLGEWFGCGRAPHAPGTVGSLGALPLYFALRGLGSSAVLVSAVLITAIGVWASSIVEEVSGIEDPQNVVIDEVAGMLVALSAAPPKWSAVLIAFVAFRLLDWAKPWPANAAERLPRGYGIMLDDVAAGAWVALILLALRAAEVL